MILLNVVRALIMVLGLVVVEAFRRGFALEGIPLIMVAGVVLIVVLVAGEVAEDSLIAYFNPEDSKS